MRGAPRLLTEAPEGAHDASSVLQKNGHGCATLESQSPKHRDRTPTRVLKRNVSKLPRITFEEGTESEASDRKEGEAEAREVEEHQIEARED